LRRTPFASFVGIALVFACATGASATLAAREHDKPRQSCATALRAVFTLDLHCRHPDVHRDGTRGDAAGASATSSGGGQSALTSTGQWTYYLLKDNFSIAGTGNSDGTIIERLDYAESGSFGNTAITSVDGDADLDGDVDLVDFGAFEVCFNGPNRPPQPNCATDDDFDDDGDVDLGDFGTFEACFNGPNQPPGPPECTHTIDAPAPPSSGTFAMHGKSVDVLPDGHLLQNHDARTYDPKEARWLQRDPTGYADGPNLYESFGSNPASFTDPLGEQTYCGYPLDVYSDMMRKSYWGQPSTPTAKEKEECGELLKTGGLSAIAVGSWALGPEVGGPVTAVFLFTSGYLSYGQRNDQFKSLTGQSLSWDQSAAIVFFDVSGISSGDVVLFEEDMLTGQPVEDDVRAKTGLHLFVAVGTGGLTGKTFFPNRLPICLVERPAAGKLSAPVQPGKAPVSLAPVVESPEALVARFPAISPTGELNLLNVAKRRIPLTVKEATAGTELPGIGPATEARFL
jgi:RHS repeat-associated protein